MSHEGRAFVKRGFIFMGDSIAFGIGMTIFGVFMFVIGVILGKAVSE